MCTNCEITETKLAKCAEELVGAYETLKAQGKELGRLKRDLSTESTPTAQAVRRVLDKWAEKHPTANTDPNGARARVVRAAIKLGHTDPPIMCAVHHFTDKRDKDAVCTVPDELIEAVEGLVLMPFVGPHGRCAVMGPGVRRFDGIEYALTDRKAGGASEATIERFRAYARWAKMAPSERLYAIHERTGAVHFQYGDLLLAALGREQGIRDVELGRPANVVDITSARKAA